MADRNKVVYKFKAPRNNNGRAKYRLESVPTRDLTARDVERLTEDELEAVKSTRMPNGNKLYAAVGGRRKKRDEDSADDEDEVDESEDEDGAADESDEASDESTVNVGAGLHTIAVDKAPSVDSE